MPNLVFSIKLNDKLLPAAIQLHEMSMVGGPRRGANQSFESFLSDLVTVAIVERSEVLTAFPSFEN